MRRQDRVNQDLLGLISSLSDLLRGEQDLRRDLQDRLLRLENIVYPAVAATGYAIVHRKTAAAVKEN